MKKLLALLLVLVLALSVVSCTLFAGDNNEEQGGVSGGVSGGSGEDADDGVELPIINVPGSWQD